MIDFDALVVGPCIAVFGEPIVYKTPGQPPITINGVYDEGYLSVGGEGGAVEMSTSNPVCGIRASDLPHDPIQGDTLLVERTGVTFVVKDWRPDSKGEIKLMLNRIS